MPCCYSAPLLHMPHSYGCAVCVAGAGEGPGNDVVPQATDNPAWNIEEDLDSLTLCLPRLRPQVSKTSGAFSWFDTKRNLLVREPARGGKSLGEIDLNGRKAYSTKLVPHSP
jgi:hypothetical protein